VEILVRKLVPLAVGAFALGMDAYVVAGLLPAISSDLHCSVSEAGLMVTTFTLSYALLSPICATLAAGRPAKVVLLTALVVFCVGNACSALAPSLGVLLLARAIAGLGAGVFIPVAAATAAGLVTPARRGRALAAITAGMSAGAALGVPLGVMIAGVEGWRACMWLVTALGVVCIAGLAVALPGQGTRAAPPALRARLGLLGNPGVASIVVVTMICSLTSIGAYTYVGELLRHTTGDTSIAGYLWAWGLGGVAGSLGVGILIDAWRDTRLLQSVILAVLAAALVTFPLLGRSQAGALVELFIWGAAGWASLAPQQHRLLARVPQFGTVAVSLNASALYLGSAAGSAAGGLLVASHGAPVEYVALGCLAALFAVLNRVSTPAAAKQQVRAEDVAPKRPTSLPRPH
jgi:predicted MFS family arabinose efflux permease